MKNILTIIAAFAFLALQAGCGSHQGGAGGGSGVNSPPWPRPAANHPLTKMTSADVSRIHEALLIAEQSTQAAYWPTLNGYKLYVIVMHELRLQQDLVATDLDRRLFLRFHALLMNSNFRVYPRINAEFIVRELNYEYYRGNL